MIYDYEALIITRKHFIEMSIWKVTIMDFRQKILEAAIRTKPVLTTGRTHL